MATSNTSRDTCTSLFIYVYLRRHMTSLYILVLRTKYIHPTRMTCLCYITAVSYLWMAWWWQWIMPSMYKSISYWLIRCQHTQGQLEWEGINQGGKQWFSTTPSVRYTLHWAWIWRHNGRDGVSNHQPHHCLLNRLFRRKSKKISKLTGLCVGNSLVTGELPAQMASNAENVSIWWRHHVFHKIGAILQTF